MGWEAVIDQVLIPLGLGAATTFVMGLRFWYYRSRGWEVPRRPWLVSIGLGIVVAVIFAWAPLGGA